MAGDNYCARIPKSPNYIYLVDISKSSADSHVAYYALSAIKDFLLSRSAEDPEMSFSLVLYDQNLHLVQFSRNSSSPSLITLDPTTLEPTYNLYLKDFIFYLSDFKSASLGTQLDILIEDLPATCTSPTADWFSLKKVINHISLSIRSHGGKVVWVHGSEGMYVPKLSNKDPTKRGFYNNNDSEIHKVSAEFHRSMAYVDLFFFGRKQNKNASVLGELIRLAGGDFFLYSGVEESDLVNFYNDLVHSCSKSQTWETVFRLRNSSGWNKHAFGNFFTSNFSDLLKIEGVDENYCMFYRFSPNKKKPPQQTSNFFFVQTSLLFTDSRRRRLLRICNYAVPISSLHRDCYLGMDYQATVAALMKENLIQLCTSKPLTDIQIELVSKFKSFLKQMCGCTDKDYQEDQMAFLGLAFLGMFKHSVFRAQHFSDYQNPFIDQINWLKVLLNRSPVECVFKQINPLLFDLSEGFLTSTSKFEYPPTLELSWEAVAGRPLVLLDDGLQMMLVFSSLNDSLCGKIFKYLLFFLIYQFFFLFFGI